MQLTDSYKSIFPSSTLKRYDWAETRNAAAILSVTNAVALEEIKLLLASFELMRGDVVDAGGQKSDIAARLDRTFRNTGWREARVDTEFKLRARLMPFREIGEKSAVIHEFASLSEGYKVDNFRERVALDVEWNAKDGNLDRDLASYRQLYAGGAIDAAILITRSFEDLRALARQLDPGSTKFATSTTTNLGKLVPRLTRGDAGGCPVLAVAITARTYNGLKTHL